MSKDSLGDRMKNYESITRTSLIPKVPTVIRLDGKAFHTYTKRFKRPYDDVLINAMDETAIYLCNKIQGAKFAYVQSDEITIAISDMDSIESQMWYDGNIQKITSVSASMATVAFNRFMILNEMMDSALNSRDIDKLLADTSIMQFAEFDSRVFQVPTIDELINCVLWRQQDATRNSIASVAQSLYSPKELHGVSCDQMQELIFQKGTNWNDLDPKLKRGRFIDKVTYINGVDLRTIPLQEIPLPSTSRTKWESVECPVFSQDRNFIHQRIKNNLL